MYNQIVGENLKRIRKLLKLTQQTMADTIEVSRQHFVNIEKGRNTLTIENIHKLSMATGYSPKEFLPDIEVKKPRYRIVYERKVKTKISLEKL